LISYLADKSLVAGIPKKNDPKNGTVQTIRRKNETERKDKKWKFKLKE
jgi:hypothetical protein